MPDFSAMDDYPMDATQGFGLPKCTSSILHICYLSAGNQKRHCDSSHHPIHYGPKGKLSVLRVRRVSADVLHQPLPRKDGRRWTTAEQEAWLNSQLPRYLEAAAIQRYNKFWPGLFQEWFEQFKEPDPDSDMATDSEPDEEPDNAPPSDNDLPSNKPTLKKRKCHGRSKRPSKKKKVGISF
jgi:hypothetical protein